MAGVAGPWTNHGVPFIPWDGMDSLDKAVLGYHGQPMVSSAPWDKGWALKSVNVGFVLSYWYDMSIVLQDSLKLGLSNAVFNDSCMFQYFLSAISKKRKLIRLYDLRKCSNTHFSHIAIPRSEFCRDYA